MAKSISWYQPDWACISLAEDKTKGRKTHKQTTTEVKSKGLEKHHKGGNRVSGDVHEVQTLTRYKKITYYLWLYLCNYILFYLTTF